MKKLKILPYKQASAAAKALAKALNVKRIKTTSTTYTPRASHVYLNYGGSVVPSWWQHGPIINNFSAVFTASNKLFSFQMLKQAGVSIPEYTTDRDTAQRWVNEGHILVGRTLLRASSGKGIVLYEAGVEVGNCPLYVKYKKKKKEFRIHVFDGKVIDFQQKKKSKDGVLCSYIRNHGNGWIFCREDVVLPEDAAEQAIRAVSSLGLTFGAVDLIWNEKENKSYVLEVNTAPGLEGTTLEKYVSAIKEYMNV